MSESESIYVQPRNMSGGMTTVWRYLKTCRISKTRGWYRGEETAKPNAYRAPRYRKKICNGGIEQRNGASCRWKSAAEAKIGVTGAGAEPLYQKNMTESVLAAKKMAASRQSGGTSWKARCMKKMKKKSVFERKWSVFDEGYFILIKIEAGGKKTALENAPAAARSRSRNAALWRLRRNAAMRKRVRRERKRGGWRAKCGEAPRLCGWPRPSEVRLCDMSAKSNLPTVGCMKYILTERNVCLRRKFLKSVL